MRKRPVWGDFAEDRASALKNTVVVNSEHRVTNALKEETFRLGSRTRNGCCGQPARCALSAEFHLVVLC